VQKITIAIVGLGKIARDQHVPALRANDTFELVAVASPHSRLDGVPSYHDVEALLHALPNTSAVALCTTPQVRFATASIALQHGRHVLLEKPPGVSVSEVLALVDLAKTKGAALFASWHSRHAGGVEAAAASLVGRSIRSVTVTWKEDVRVWHPGQRWIWIAGGLGVLDPGINALSILTRILPGTLALRDAELFFPANCETPIAARLLLAESGGAPVRAEFDFRHTGPQTWDIEIETDSGTVTLSMGGSVLKIDNRVIATPPSTEYSSLYKHFAELVREQRIDVDVAPLQLVADAFLSGRRVVVEPLVD
jgi:D-galactose 1-dehydrogenase